MKVRSFEELNNELNTAIIENKREQVYELAKQLGANINPNHLFTAISYNKLSLIPYLGLVIAGHHNYSLTQAFKNLPNPIDTLLSVYTSLVHNPEYLEYKEILFESLMKTIELFKKYDCFISGASLMLAREDQRIVDSLLDHKNIHIDPSHLSSFIDKPEVFKKVVKKVVDINKVEPNSQHVIFSAIGMGSVEVIDILLEENIDLNITNDYGGQPTTPVLCAIYQNKPLIAEHLISQGAIFDRQLISKTYASQPHVVDFVVEHDQSVKKFVENISSENAYELFKKAKEINDILIVSYFLKEHAHDIFSVIKRDGAQKEHIAYFQKNGIPFKFKHGEFLVCSQPQARKETEQGCESNTQDIQEKSKTCIIEGKFYYTYGEKKLVTFNEQNDSIYVISKNGDLYVQNDLNGHFNGLHHSFFLKSKPTKELYGYGKPVACGGHMNIVDGKITFINNCSGHYQPTLTQLKLVVKYFHQKGVLSENVQVKDINGTLYDLSEILNSPIIDETPELFGNNVENDF
ncbi:hypothetical protein [Candidatus Bandiella numerosa]|uniref:hypothetical protein n=1 Tax=Candidatus Bandiella numerosa TaxID=2570586 RepID=UPI001F3896A8|nr:hypothetical protein [Candidatus Bandiella numerosa]